MIALTTPPLKRPYSAEMPEVSTWVSSMASSMNRLCGCASTLSLTSTPLTMKALSNANAPLMTIWFAFGEFSDTAGESWAIPCNVRGVASSSISGCLKLIPTTGCRSARGIGDDLDRLNHAARRRSTSWSPSGRAAHRRPGDGREAAQFELDVIGAWGQRGNRVIARRRR